MKITCLVENSVPAGSSHLWDEHGPAFIIETREGTVLFDTGQSGTVIMHNLQQLGILPESIDVLVISHGHYDHTGGLRALLELLRPGIPLYAHPDIFTERYSRRKNLIKNIGSPTDRKFLEHKVVLKLANHPQAVLPGVWTTGEILPRHEPEGRSVRHVVKKGVSWGADPYMDDMALVVQISSGLVLICGCCHAGLLNTISRIQSTFDPVIRIIMGGTHLIT